MGNATVAILNFVFVVAWIAGIVLAKGFWSTFFAVMVPLWGWYLIVEKIMIAQGFI
jgi:hypothetical protein